MTKNKDIASEFFSVRDLADLRLPGYPSTVRRLKDMLDKSGWEQRDVPSPGRGGQRREYHPPEAVMALIRARQAEREAEEGRRTLVGLGRSIDKLLGPNDSTNPASHQGAVKRTPIPGAPLKATTLEPSLEFMARVAMASAKVDYLGVLDTERRLSLVLDVFNLLQYLSSWDESRMDELFRNDLVLESAIKLIHEISNPPSP